MTENERLLLMPTCAICAADLWIAIRNNTAVTGTATITGTHTAPRKNGATTT